MPPHLSFATSSLQSLLFFNLFLRALSFRLGDVFFYSFLLFSFLLSLSIRVFPSQGILLFWSCINRFLVQAEWRFSLAVFFSPPSLFFFAFKSWGWERKQGLKKKGILSFSQSPGWQEQLDASRKTENGISNRNFNWKRR